MPLDARNALVAFASAMILSCQAEAQQTCTSKSDELVNESEAISHFLETRIAIAISKRDRPLACSLVWTLDRHYNEISSLLDQCGDYSTAQSLLSKSAELANALIDYQCSQLFSAGAD